MYKSDRFTFQEILSAIEFADDIEINEVIAAVRRRYQALFPDWEVLYISCPKNDPEERKRTIEFIINHFRCNT